MPKLSVVIVLYKSEEYIFQCLDSIAEYSDMDNGDYEIILVDNYVGSNFVEPLTHYKQTSKLNIKYIVNVNNGGFGNGNNVGVASSDSKVILFLNPDTKIQNKFSFKKIHETVKGNTVAGFRIIDANGKENYSYGIFPEYTNLSILPYISRKFWFDLPNKIFFLNKIIWPWGAAFAIEREKFIEIGGFDEKIFLCNEEPDLLKRIPSRKVCLLDMPVIHFEGHTTGSTSVRFEHYLKSTDYYLKKNALSTRKFFLSLIFKEYIKGFYGLSKGHKERILAAKKYL